MPWPPGPSFIRSDGDQHPRSARPFSSPRRKQAISWKDFIRAHRDVLAVIDFFTTEVLTLKGLTTYYVLFLIHLETRLVNLAGFTPYPDQEWMEQQAPNRGKDLRIHPGRGLGAEFGANTESNVVKRNGREAGMGTWPRGFEVLSFCSGCLRWNDFSLHASGPIGHRRSLWSSTTPP